jgi:hypothetical protein
MDKRSSLCGAYKSSGSHDLVDFYTTVCFSDRRRYIIYNIYLIFHRNTHAHTCAQLSIDNRVKNYDTATLKFENTIYIIICVCVYVTCTRVQVSGARLYIILYMMYIKHVIYQLYVRGSGRRYAVAVDTNRSGPGSIRYR